MSDNTAKVLATFAAAFAASVCMYVTNGADGMALFTIAVIFIWL